MIEKDKNPANHPWVVAAQTRGLENALLVLLDVIEPIGSILAQLLWVVQPAAGIMGARQTVADLALLLDEPENIEALRLQLLNQHDHHAER